MKVSQKIDVDGAARLTAAGREGYLDARPQQPTMTRVGGYTQSANNFAGARPAGTMARRPSMAQSGTQPRPV